MLSFSIFGEIFFEIVLILRQLVDFFQQEGQE